MMKHEFENIAGYEVSWDDYNKIIEPMYSATNLSKEEFVKTLNKKRFALVPLKTLVKRMQKEAEHLKETCTHYTDYESKEKLDDIVKEYIDRKYGERCHYKDHDDLDFLTDEEKAIIVNAVLDKMRAEIEKQKECRCFDDDDMYIYMTGLNDAIDIIDKYNVES